MVWFMDGQKLRWDTPLATFYKCVYFAYLPFFNLIRVGGLRVAEYAQKLWLRLMSLNMYWEIRSLRLSSLLIGDYDATECLMMLHNIDGFAETQKTENYIQNTKEQKEWA